MCPHNTGPAAKLTPSAAPPVPYPPPNQVHNPLPPQPPPQFIAPTGIIVVAPPTPVQPPQWTTGLFECLDDPSNCLTTLICPCVTFGQNAEVLDKGNTSCFCAGTACFCLFYCFGVFCCYTCTYRSKIRGLFSLPGDQCGDFFVHCLCTLCAFCQEYRELKNRGLDPSLGWSAAQQRMQPAVPVVVPPMPAQMNR
ncbi:hypothetical protein SAY87_007725 [Trapa incisa]|uniref:Uncharacterized protein n=1 Tax=Trapa incisa TaxID=236973 RepID=A0AAN7QFW9_9MYRT|nr:hypothetical protein SAY87_007725 [Trapa incisa]